MFNWRERKRLLKEVGEGSEMIREVRWKKEGSDVYWYVLKCEKC